MYYEQMYLMNQAKRIEKTNADKEPKKPEFINVWKCINCKNLNEKNTDKCAKCGKCSFLKYWCQMCEILTGGKICANCNEDTYTRLYL